MCYNLRVTETTLAALVLANATLGNCNGIERLRDVHENLRIAGKIKKTNANESVFVDELTYMEELVETVLTKKDGYSVEEISTLVGLDVR